MLSIKYLKVGLKPIFDGYIKSSDANALLYLEDHPNYLRYSSILSDGWLFGRKVVCYSFKEES